MLTKMLTDMYFANKVRVIPPGAQNVFKQIEEAVNSFFVPGLINLDEADLLAILYGCDATTIIIIEASGENRIEKLREDMTARMPEDFKERKPKGAIFNVIGGSDLTLHDAKDVAEIMYEEIHDDAMIIFGAVIDEEMGNHIKVVSIFASS